MTALHRKPWSGLIAAAHTPMHPDGTLNAMMIDRQARHLARAGVRGVFICGSTGECHSLTLGERQEVNRGWIGPAKAHGLKLIVHVGHNCLKDARKLAREAGELGAAAISAMAPSYFKPAGVSELVEFCEAVAAEAPGLPFYYYDIPGMSGVRLSMEEFLRKGSARIPSLAGLKYSNHDMVQLQRCLRLDDGRFEILFGCDELLLSALALGVRGAVGSSYNYAAPLFHALIEAFESGDMSSAEAYQYEAVRMIDLLIPWGVIPSGKAMMAWLGVDCGPARPPLRSLSTEQLRELRERFRDLATLTSLWRAEDFSL